MNSTKSSPSPSKRGKKIASNASSQSNKLNAWLTKIDKKESTSSSKNGNKKENRDISDISNVEPRDSTKKSKLEKETKTTEKQLNDEFLQTKDSKRSRKEDIKKWTNLTALGELDNKKTKKKESKVESVKNSDDFKENLKNISPSREGSTKKIRKSIENEKLTVSLSEEIGHEGNTTSKKYRKTKPPKSSSVSVGKKLYDIDMWQGSSITSWLTLDEKIKSLSEINSTRQKKSVDVEENKKIIGNSTDKNNGIKQTKNTTIGNDENSRRFEKVVHSKPRSGKAKKEGVNGSPFKQTNSGKYKRVQSNTVSNWLSKDTARSKLKNKTNEKQEEIVELDTSEESSTKLENKVSSGKYKKNYVKKDKVRSETKTKSDKSSKKRSRSKSGSVDNGKSPVCQQQLDSFINVSKDRHLDKQRKPNLKRQTSQNSEFPSFEKVKKPKTNKNSEFFKKYGMRIPSVEEILKEQKDYEKYKTQLESFQAMEDFALPFSVKDLNITQENNKIVLGCTHLSFNDLDEAFKKNLTYISDIFHGRKYSERHEKFFSNNNKGYNLSIKDLTYSTSMIVFNFEQKEHLITLLTNSFDPEDKKTPYFFQVLLPELCLKIFMDTHDMTHDEAVEYLETRPIVDD